MIALIVHFNVKPSDEEKTKELIRKMQENSRREAGCRMYVGHQSAEDSRRFCFYEQYENQDALDAHRVAPYFAEYVTNGLAKLFIGRTQELFTTVD